MSIKQNKLTSLDIEMILDEKPYDLDTAIYYVDKMSLKYNKQYCVVRNKDKYRKKPKYDIIGLEYFIDHIPEFEVYYISKIKKRIE